jgi:hypothetical protein
MSILSQANTDYGFDRWFYKVFDAVTRAMPKLSKPQSSLESGKKLLGKDMTLWTMLVLLALFFGSSVPARAQAVTWTETDLEYIPPTKGTFTYTAGSPPSYTTAGTGTGFGSNYDYLAFVSTPTCGNIELEAQVTSQSSTNTAAFAGLMMRDGFDPTGAMASIGVTVGGVVSFNYRPRFSFTTTVNGPTVSTPIYLRLTRSPTTITGYYSTDNETWILVGTETTTPAVMPNLYYAGFTTFSGDSTQNTSVLKFVSYMTSVPQPAANLQLWLRSDCGVVSSSGAVSQWSDQSGNSNNATQTVAGNKPTLTTGVLNNAVLPSLTFSGSQYLTMPAGFTNFSPGSSIFLVLKPSSSSATCDACAFGNATNSDAFFAQSIGTQASFSAYDSTTSSTVTTTTNPLSTSAFKLLEAVYSPGATNGIATIFVNGSQIKQSTSMVATLNNISRADNYIGTGIGLTNYFQGSIAEVLVFSSPLTSSQRASVESYVLSKFGVGTAPTLDAPTFSLASASLLPAQPVTVSQDQGATCWFTINGTTPTNSITSQWMNSIPISVLSNRSILSIAVAPFFNNSPVISATYTVDPLSSAIPRSGLTVWLRGDSQVTTVGTAVSAWGDASGSSNGASQTVSADQPSLVASAINGLPAISFNGTSSFLALPSGLSNLASGVSCFAVMKPTSVSAGARVFDFGNGTTSDNVYLSEPTSTGVSLYTYNGSSGTSVTSSSAVTVSQFQLVEAINNGTGTATIYTNGVQGAQNTSMNTMNNLVRADNFIGKASGGGNYFKGQLAELIFYNRGVTKSEQAAIEGYSFSKYQLNSSLATLPPIISVAAGTLTAPTQVAIEAPAAATIFYTTNGTAPGITSFLYSTPIWVSSTQTVKAIAVINGVQSSVASAAYTLNSTRYPAPGTTTTPLQLNLQLPNVSIPQDGNQH